MFRRAMLICLGVIFCLVVVADASACHRCRHRRGYGYSGCGYGYYGNHSYRVAKVYRTVRVPVQTCTMTCVATCDPCGNLTYTSTPTYSTTYVTQKVLVHSQVVGPGPVYGNYLDGSRRQVAGGYGYSGYGYAGRGYGNYGHGSYGYGGYGYGGYRTPYRSGYGAGYGSGLGGGYRMGGYGAAAAAADSYVARYQAVKTDADSATPSAKFAF